MYKATLESSTINHIYNSCYFFLSIWYSLLIFHSSRKLKGGFFFFNTCFATALHNVTQQPTRTILSVRFEKIVVPFPFSLCFIVYLTKLNSQYRIDFLTFRKINSLDKTSWHKNATFCHLYINVLVVILDFPTLSFFSCFIYVTRKSISKAEEHFFCDVFFFTPQRLKRHKAK